jgi:hypothetical protein
MAKARRPFKRKQRRKAIPIEPPAQHYLLEPARDESGLTDIKVDYKLDAAQFVRDRFKAHKDAGRLPTDHGAAIQVARAIRQELNINVRNGYCDRLLSIDSILTILRELKFGRQGFTS